jgi:WD40 repeat protein
VLSGSDDRTARLWDVETGREVGRLAGLDVSALAVAFSPDGRTAIVGGRAGLVRVWALPDFTAVAPGPAVYTKGLPQLDRLALSPDGRLAIFACYDGKARLWDVVAGKELRVLVGHDHGKVVRFAAFSPDGTRACTSSEDGTVRVWSVETGKELLKIDADPGATAWSAVFSPDGSRILSGGGDGIAYLWNTTDGTKLQTFANPTHEKMINWVAFTPDGSMALTASHDEKFPLGVWDVATGNLVRRLETNKGAASVAVSADGRFAISGGTDRKMRLWLLETGDLLHTFEGHTTSVWGIAFSPDGRVAASAGGEGDNTVRIWDVRYGNLITTFTGHTGGVTAVCVTPDSRRAASVSKDRSFRWWNLPPR